MIMRNLSPALGLVAVALATPVHALPITPALDGTGTRVSQQGNTFNIDGGSRAGANQFHSFQNFGLNQQQVANFISNPQTQNILARVVGGNASIINGLMQVTGSNANLYLINPVGIVFGSNASLNVPSAFTATTANSIGIGNAWLNANGSNNYASLTGNPNSFVFNTTSSGSIVNTANLNSTQGISLIGGNVINAGNINAPVITLAAVPGTNLVRISQPGHILSLEVVLTQDQNIAPLDLPRLLSGQSLPGISSNGETVQVGGVIIPAGRGTNITTGNLNAAGNRGETINILGDRVALLNAYLNASGVNGGGTIRIGGEYKGGGVNPFNSQITYVDTNTFLNADALNSGNGGRVIVWADNTTNFYGNIFARGGRNGGNGGFAEVSGKINLTFAGNANLSAPFGIAGTLLLDPTNIVINAGPDALGTCALPTVTLVCGPGAITISTATLNAQVANVTLNAAGNIDFLAAVNIAAPGVGLTANAGAQITINSNISTNGGDINFNSVSNGGIPAVAMNNAVINANGGNIAFTATSGGALQTAQIFNLINSQLLTSGAGNITLTNTIGNQPIQTALRLDPTSVIRVVNGIINLDLRSNTTSPTILASPGSLVEATGNGRIQTNLINQGNVINVPAFGSVAELAGTFRANSGRIDITATHNGNNPDRAVFRLPNTGLIESSSGVINIQATGNGAGRGAIEIGGNIGNDSGSTTIRANQTSSSNAAIVTTSSSTVQSRGSGGVTIEASTANNSTAAILDGEIRTGGGGINVRTNGSLVNGFLSTVGGAVNVTVNNGSTSASSGSLPLTIGTQSTGNGGNITIRVPDGTIDLGILNSSAGGNGGNISITGLGDINTSNIITISGGVGGNAGGLFIISSNGGINATSLIRTISGNGQGGNVDLFALQDIKVGQIDASGITGGAISLSGNSLFTNGDIRTIRNYIDLFGRPVNLYGSTNFIAQEVRNTFSFNSGVDGGYDLGILAPTIGVAIDLMNPTGFLGIGNVNNSRLRNVSIGGGIDVSNSGGDGGYVDIRATGSVGVQGNINVSGTGNGGNVIINGSNIRVDGYINAGGGINGGNVFTDSQSLQISGTLVDRNGTTASISATGGTSSPGRIILNLLNSPLPFVVGDPTDNGTAGLITNSSGSGNIIPQATYSNRQTQDSGRLDIVLPCLIPGGCTTPPPTPATPTPLEVLSEFLRLLGLAPQVRNNPVSYSGEERFQRYNIFLDPLFTSFTISWNNRSSGILTIPVDIVLYPVELPVSDYLNLPRSGFAGSSVTIGQILNPSERSRSEVFRNTLSIPPSITESPNFPSIPYVLGQQAISNLDTNAELAVEQIDQVLSQQFIQYTDGDYEFVSFANIQASLKAIKEQTGKTAVVVYAITFGGNLRLILVRPEGPPLTENEIKQRDGRLVRKMHIDRSVRDLYNDLTKADDIRYRQKAIELYDWLVKPVAGELERLKVDNLIYIMDGGLRQIPLAVLYDKDKDQYLIEKYSVGTAPSMGLMNREYRPFSDKIEVLAMGSTNFPGTMLSRIPHTDLELRSIQTRIGMQKVSRFFEDQFDRNSLESEVRRARYGVVHLATHARFQSYDNATIYTHRETVGMDSFRRIRDKKIPIELLVLSACETAGDQGRIDLYTEIGFAGVAVRTHSKSALASLWRVNDRATMVLMDRFYKNLVKPETKLKTEALRQAQLAMLRGEVYVKDGSLYYSNGECLKKSDGGCEILPSDGNYGNQANTDFKNPYYWAGFTMVGSPW